MSDEGTSLILIAGWARGVQWKVRNIIEKHALQMSIRLFPSGKATPRRKNLNYLLTLINYVYCGRFGRSRSFFGPTRGKIMWIWLESDAVAVCTLLFALVAIELIAFSI
jgi:hypothetical protein